jgi:pimeloyl-ACP methyl ester carboxylesterase
MFAANELHRSAQPQRTRLIPLLRSLSAVLAALLSTAPPLGALEAQSRGSVQLEPCLIPNTEEEMLCGSYDVYENRVNQQGRVISLNLAVLPAVSPSPRPDPIFYLEGGPGGAATAAAIAFLSSSLRRDRDFVFVDQRGTGGSNPLPCQASGGAGDLGPYLQCKEELEKIADLTQYTTPVAMDDLDHVRAAMGYDQINLFGGSYGSRAALIYLRRHPEHARTAVLSGIAPGSLIFPLYVAQAAQRAIDLIFEQCAQDADCAAAYPDIAYEFQATLERLEQHPVQVTVFHPDTGGRINVELTRAVFAAGIRLLMYSLEGTRFVPYVISLTYQGFYEPITQYMVDINYDLSPLVQAGMTLSVLCTEDLPRIDPAAIPALTENTFLGDGQIRDFMAICEIWPRAELPAFYSDPVVSDIPVLLWSGTLDPVTPPQWGEEAAQYLSNSLHLVVPGAHDLLGGCIDKVSSAFMNRASATELRTSCLNWHGLPSFELPE